MCMTHRIFIHNNIKRKKKHVRISPIIYSRSPRGLRVPWFRGKPFSPGLRSRYIIRRSPVTELNGMEWNGDFGCFDGAVVVAGGEVSSEQ